MPAAPSNAEAVTGDSDRISGRAWQALAAGAAGYVLFNFNATATNLAFDSIQAEFSSASSSVVGWVASGFFVASAAFLPLGGRLADRLGRRRMFTIGMALVTVAALASWAAPTVWFLIAARVAQAIGGALVIPASLSMVLPLFPSSRRATAVSTWAAAGPLSAAVAPTVAALLLDTTTWRWVYFVTAPIAALVTLVSPLFVPESKGEPAAEGSRLDYGGTVMLTLSIALLVVGISQGRVWGWTSWATILVILEAIALFAAFIVRSLSHPTPLLNVRLFRVPEVAVANLANLFISITSMSIWLIWPLWLKRIWNYDSAHIGFAITIGPLFAGPASILGGRLADRYGQRWLMITGSAIATASVTYTVFSLGPEPNYWVELAPAIAGFGFGWGLSHPQMNAWALDYVPAAYFGESNAAFNTLRNVGAAVGTAGAVAILGAEDRPDVFAAYDRANIFFAFWVGLAFLTVLIGTSWLARRHRARRSAGIFSE